MGRVKRAQAANARRWADSLNEKEGRMENELLDAAKELLNDFELYGNPIQLRVIARLRRAVEAAQQSVQADNNRIGDFWSCTKCGDLHGVENNSCGCGYRR